MNTHFIQRPDGASVAVDEIGSDGPVVVLLHGLAGSSREMIPTARALSDHRVLMVDQRGHGRTTRRPEDLSRAAFVSDVIAVIEELSQGQRVTLVGQSMGAHTAFLVAATRPDLVDGLVMLEGHVAGNEDPEEAAGLGRYFASWPAPFADEKTAREFLGDEAIVDAWVADLKTTPTGLVPRFDADIMQRTIEAVHEPSWEQWQKLSVPTVAIFAKNGMFSEAEKSELIRRRPDTHRVDLSSGSHDAHLDNFEEWIGVLQLWMSREGTRGTMPWSRNCSRSMCSRTCGWLSWTPTLGLQNLSGKA